jgi:hypothetical protein
MQRIINENPINPAGIEGGDNEAYRMMMEIVSYSGEINRAGGLSLGQVLQT